MNLNDFFCNNHKQRAALVWIHGELIAVRNSGNYTVCLHAIGRFFAEIWYRKEDKQIHLVKGFSNNAQLEPYLAMVDIKDIIT